MQRQTGLFRSSTYRPIIAKGIRLGSLWGAVALCANLLWNLGPRTSFGPASTAAVFPLLIVAANVGHRSQWRLSLCHTVSFSIPACTLFLFLTLLPPRGDLRADPIEKLAAILYEVAEFLRENAVTTTIGLAVLLAAHRTSPPKAEGNAFRTAIVVAGLALLSVSANHILPSKTYLVADELARLRASLPSVVPTRYRGISRDPFELLPECSPDEPDARALSAMRDLVLVDSASVDPLVHLLPDRPAALRVHELLDNPLDYEIAFVSRDPAVPARDSYGFDIGYWGGDHFSLICDAAIAPRWHPPDPDDYAQLAVQLRVLNAHSLFPTRDHARAFSEYDQSRSWAESELEPGQFVIIEVGAG